jgi:hypothetical protein
MSTTYDEYFLDVGAARRVAAYLQRYHSLNADARLVAAALFALANGDGPIVADDTAE